MLVPSQVYPERHILQQKRAPERKSPAPSLRDSVKVRDRSIHVVVAAVAAAAGGLLVLGHVGDQGVGGQQQGADARGVLQGRAGDLGRVDDAGLDQVGVLVLQRVV